MIHRQPSIEGLRHARNLIHKQWLKERQRARDLKTRNDLLVEENDGLKAQLELATRTLRALRKR